MTRLQETMIALCQEFDVRINLDMDLALSSGRIVSIEIHLPDFGGQNGILVSGSSATLHEISHEIISMGFGYSILSEPTTASDYSDEGFVEMLADWTWCGDPEKRPHWLPS